jgi:hypothetical protein
VSAVLAATLHDPEDRLHEQLVRVLGWLQGTFLGIALQPTTGTSPRTLRLLAGAGARVADPQAPGGLAGLGRARRAAVGEALELAGDRVLLCDFDRILHWAERFPGELAAVAADDRFDFTVAGRTERAFATHPAHQRETEAVINRVFAAVFGSAWDVTAGARSLSRAAAVEVVAESDDDAISTDVSWPLLLRRGGRFSVGYTTAEGLEFETADRHGGEVAAVGGLDAWLAVLDRDPRRWAHRLELARIEVAAMIPYAE